MTELTAIKADEYRELKIEDKIQIILDEKQAELDAIKLEQQKQDFFVAMQKELASFDATAIERIGTFQSAISAERTIIEMRWKDAEGKGMWEMPV